MSKLVIPPLTYWIAALSASSSTLMSTARQFFVGEPLDRALGMIGADALFKIDFVPDGLPTILVPARRRPSRLMHLLRFSQREQDDYFNSLLDGNFRKNRNSKCFKRYDVTPNVCPAYCTLRLFASPLSLGSMCPDSQVFLAPFRHQLRDSR